MKIVLKEEMFDKEDRILINNFKKYRDYNTIRRNLREAYDLINYILEFQDKVLSDKDGLNKYKDNVRIMKPLLFHSLILYSKWFGNTKGKHSLNGNKYFKGEYKKYLKTHKYIIKLRNKYIAHNEEDLLGGDKVQLEIDDLNNIKLMSTWKETLIVSKQDLQDVKKCIEIIHNIIDAQEIPKYEKYLVGNLKEKTSFIRSLINESFN